MNYIIIINIDVIKNDIKRVYGSTPRSRKVGGQWPCDYTILGNKS